MEGLSNKRILVKQKNASNLENNFKDGKNVKKIDKKNEKRYNEYTNE